MDSKYVVRITNSKFHYSRYILTTCVILILNGYALLTHIIDASNGKFDMKRPDDAGRLVNSIMLFMSVLFTSHTFWKYAEYAEYTNSFNAYLAQVTGKYEYGLQN